MSQREQIQKSHFNRELIAFMVANKRVTALYSSPVKESTDLVMLLFVRNCIHTHIGTVQRFYEMKLRTTLYLDL